MKKQEKKEEKNAKMLTEAEKKRAERFEKISEDMIQQGYTRHELTVDINKASIFAVVLTFLLFFIGYGLFFLINHRFDFSEFRFSVLLIVFLIFVVVHELIHGVCWSIFTPNHFKDIEFGIMKPSLSPYCTCLVPLNKQHYLFGTVMPLIILGIVPMLVGLVIGNPNVLFIGIVMSGSAAGDILIIQRVLGYKSSANEIVYMDHPTEAGGVIFER